MYRFLLRPAWLVSHLLVAALVLSMIWLSQWQFRRLDDKRAENALVAANAEADPLTLPEAIALVAAEGVEAAQFRPVQVAGRYVTDQEVAVRNRSFAGAPGRWIVTPLASAEGDVLVARGFAPLAVDDIEPPFEAAAPAATELTALGYIQPTQERGSFGPTDPDTGTLGEMARVDVDRVAQQYGELAPFWLQLAGQDPAPSADVLTLIPLPEPDEGPHLGYAVQWLIFTVIAVGGYPIILRRVAKQRAAAGPDPEPGPDAGPSADAQVEEGAVGG